MFGPPLYLIISAIMLVPFLVIYIFIKKYIISKKNGFDDDIIDPGHFFDKKDYIVGIIILFAGAYFLTYFPIFS